MRIATSTIYSDQIASIDNTNATYQQLASQLSSGYAVQAPSDDPVQIAQALNFSNAITTGNQTANNLTDSQNRLNQTDSALSTLTSILQSARQFAVQGASDTLSQSQLQDLGTQVDQLLGEAINLANTQYNGTYVFGGTAANTSPPVVAAAQPNSGIKFTGNYQNTGQIFINGTPVQTSVTITQAFNFTSNASNPGYNNINGSPDVFTVLRNLRDTLNQSQIVDGSATAVNRPGQSIALSTALSAASFATALTPDDAGDYSIQIAGSNAAGSTAVQTFTFTGLTTIGGVELAINAASLSTGVSASFDPKAERLFLTSSTGAFTVNDVATPGFNSAANFTSVFGLTQQADVVNNVSRQLGDIDNVLNVALQARANVGAAIQVITQTTSQNSTAINLDTQVKSSIEDVDVAKASTQYTATQSILQAAYSTTAQLEKYDLLQFIS